MKNKKQGIVNGVVLDDEPFKIRENKRITITDKYYVGKECDLFIGRDYKQIQFMILSLYLADHYQSKYQLPNGKISMMLDFNVYKAMFSSLKKHKFKALNIFEIHIEGLFDSTICSEDEVFVIVDTKIFQHNYSEGNEREYVSVWVGDVLETKSTTAMYLKMKMYTQKRDIIPKYIDGLTNIDKNDMMILIVSKREFIDFTNCGENISMYLRRGLESINKSPFGIKVDCEVFDKIILKLKTIELAKNIKNNCLETSIKINKKPNKVESSFVCEKNGGK